MYAGTFVECSHLRLIHGLEKSSEAFQTARRKLQANAARAWVESLGEVTTSV